MSLDAQSVDERPRRVAYVSSAALIAAADLLPSNSGRASRVDALIEALPACLGVCHVESQRATANDLRAFHSRELIGTSHGSGAPLTGADALLDEQFRLDDAVGPAEASDDALGLTDDCPRFEGIANYVLEVAGASITAARQLREGRADVRLFRRVPSDQPGRNQLDGRTVRMRSLSPR